MLNLITDMINLYKKDAQNKKITNLLIEIYKACILIYGEEKAEKQLIQIVRLIAHYKNAKNKFSACLHLH